MANATEEKMSRYKKNRWSCVPAWLTEFLGWYANPDDALHMAAVAGNVISLSCTVGAPIKVNYQMLWGSMWHSHPFTASSVSDVDLVLKNLLEAGVISMTSDGKLMAGPVSYRHEKDFFPSSYWDLNAMHREVYEMTCEKPLECGQGQGDVFLDLG